MEDTDAKRVRLRKLKIILVMIQSNNYIFPDGEKRVLYNLLYEKYSSALDEKYAIIAIDFKNIERLKEILRLIKFNNYIFTNGEIKEEFDELSTAYNDYLDDDYKAIINEINNIQQQKPHFNGDYTDEELTATFEKLKMGKYIHSKSDLDSWIYLCTGREEKAFTEPINWTKSRVLLGMFVQDLFSDTDNTAIWKLTAKCFTVKGKTPNTNSIKASLSKIKQDWKARPKDYDKMQNEIIKDIK